MISDSYHHPAKRVRCVEALIVLAAIFLHSLAGCTAFEGSNRPVPKEVMISMETGEWTLVYEKDATKLPTWVPVVTDTPSGLREGLILIPGTPGYAAVLPYGRRASPGMSSIRFPTLISPRGTGWEISFAEFGITGETLSQSESEPLAIAVPIDPPGLAEPGPTPNVKGVGYLR